MIKTIYFISGFALFYIYIGYAVVLYIYGLFTKKNRFTDDEYKPFVTLIIPAHNEADCIENKIKNAIGIDYDKDKLEIIVASDASTDNTVQLAKRMSPEIKVLDFAERSGKMGTVNKAVKEASGEIIILTDANSLFASYTVRQLVRHFINPLVGCVGGAKIIRNAPSAINSTGMGEGRYWKYETVLKTIESRTGSCVGVDGSIYAVRRSIYPFPPTDRIIMDDLAVSLMVIKSGFECIFEPNARAFEESSEKVKDEFIRKARIFAGAFSLFVAKPNLLLSNIFLKLLSHKILRWLTLLFQISLFLSSYFLRHDVSVRPIFGIQVVFYGCVAIGFLLDKIGARLPIFHAPYYFTMTTVAQLYGFIFYIRNRRKASWERRR